MHYWNIMSQFPSYPIIFLPNQRNRKIHHRDTKKINIPNGAIFRLIRQHLPRQARSPLNLGIKRWQCSQLTEDTHTHLLLLFFFFGRRYAYRSNCGETWQVANVFKRVEGGGGRACRQLFRDDHNFSTLLILDETQLFLWKSGRREKEFRIKLRKEGRREKEGG